MGKEIQLEKENKQEIEKTEEIKTIEENKDIENSEEEKVDEEVILQTFTEVLNEFTIAEDGQEVSLVKELGKLLSLPDSQFNVLAPGLLNSFSQQINNPDDKITMVQLLNVAGMKAEDLTDSFDEIAKTVEETKGLSKNKKDFILQLLGIITNAVNETEGISKRIVQVPIEKCNAEAKIPTYANVTDSGMDLYALEDYVINPGETKLIPTGLKIGLPPGYELQVRPKSGRALKTKLRVANTPGTIDAGYRDEIKVIIENIEPPIKDIGYEFNEDGSIHITSIVHGEPYYIGKGEKFAQIVLSEVPKISFLEVDSVGEIGENRGGGFGSTGLK